MYKVNVSLLILENVSDKIIVENPVVNNSGGSSNVSCEGITTQLGIWGRYKHPVGSRCVDPCRQTTFNTV